jgi:hypothetical protein
MCSMMMSFAKNHEPNTIRGGGCWTIMFVVKFVT